MGSLKAEDVVSCEKPLKSSNWCKSNAGERFLIYNNVEPLDFLLLLTCAEKEGLCALIFFDFL